MATANRAAAIIPARFASTRFPGKVIADLAGKPLVVHVHERARRARTISEAVIATDDARVAEAVAPFGVPVVMTRPDHPSGTDRIAEAALQLDAGIIVNVQGDEPLIDPATIDAAVQPLLDDPDLHMATVRCPIRDPRRVLDPNVVKVVCGRNGRALYFSRSPIPHVRDAESSGGACHWQHIGLYVYRREFLLKYAAMAPTPLEQIEKLEQLRVLENGYDIAVVDTEHVCIGVDTPEDLEEARRLFSADQAEGPSAEG